MIEVSWKILTWSRVFALGLSGDFNEPEYNGDLCRLRVMGRSPWLELIITWSKRSSLSPLSREGTLNAKLAEFGCDKSALFR